ncbi:MAG: M42 family metallopeptidase [Eubacteriales bacterium]|nr:M42 family metallopeptidase [Eubacteriales bacterium]
MKELIRKLSELRGISGSEYRISDEIINQFKAVSDEVYKDNLGNVIAVKKCKKGNAPRIMIEAHMDEIGLMVRDIDENGFIGFVNIGGVDGRILPGGEVIIHGLRDVKGVIGAKPPHLQTADEAKTALKMSDMVIDTGLTSEQIREIVSVGDTITVKGDFRELLSDNVTGKSLDDRAGIAALIKTFEMISGKELNADIYAVAAVCEEVGGRGAAVAGYSIKPDIAIAIDVTHGVTPDNSKNGFELGSGVAIAKGPNLHPLVVDRLLGIAKEKDIKYTIEVEGGDTGTDAWILQVVDEGIPTALLSIPLRYMHTTVETLNIKDAEAISKLLAEFCLRIDDNMEEWLCF